MAEDHKIVAEQQIPWLAEDAETNRTGEIAITHALLYIGEQIERLANMEQMKDPDYQEWLANQNLGTGESDENGGE